jgi:hypothetical protein
MATSHARKQTRDAVVAACTGLQTTGSSVFVSRAYAMSQRYMPALVVLGTEEQVGLAQSGIRQPTPRLQERRVTVQVVGIAVETDDVQDTLDEIALEVERAVLGDPSLGGLSSDTTATGTRVTFAEADGGTMGQVEITFEATVLTDEGDPASVLPQND